MYLGLKYDSDSLGKARKSILMSWSLYHSEPLFSSVAKAPAIGVDVLGGMVGPRSLIESCYAIKKLPVAVVIFLHGSRSFVVFGEQNHRGVRPKGARVRKVCG